MLTGHHCGSDVVDVVTGMSLSASMASKSQPGMLTWKKCVLRTETDIKRRGMPLKES